VHTSREKGVFGDVGAAGIIVEREEEQPCYADDDTKGREEWEVLEDLCGAKGVWCK
jgi:hypothetical protein